MTFRTTHCRRLAAARSRDSLERLRKLHRMLRYSSSFLDRLEEVGIVIARQRRRVRPRRADRARLGARPRHAQAVPLCRLRKCRIRRVPIEAEGDGYARLRVLFREAAQSAAIIREHRCRLAARPGRGADPALGRRAAHSPRSKRRSAPRSIGCAWTRTARCARYRMTPPSFTNWHGFHLAAENFAFQDFPIILASFGLSNAECDR